MIGRVDAVSRRFIEPDEMVAMRVREKVGERSGGAIRMRREDVDGEGELGGLHARVWDARAVGFWREFVNY